MASHISAVPNHTVFRTTSLKYRIDVAMSGRLGMEIQPKNMTDEEKALCKKAISEYKEIRVCVLTYLNIDNTDISVLVKTSSKTISNARKKANRKLVGDDSASTLDENLLKFKVKVHQRIRDVFLVDYFLSQNLHTCIFFS